VIDIAFFRTAPYNTLKRIQETVKDTLLTLKLMSSRIGDYYFAQSFKRGHTEGPKLARLLYSVREKKSVWQFKIGPKPSKIAHKISKSLDYRKDFNSLLPFQR